MPNYVNRKVGHYSNTWDKYIAEAKSQLADIEERKKGLLVVIARFERFRDSGEPWPLDGNVMAMSGHLAAV